MYARRVSKLIYRLLAPTQPMPWKLFKKEFPPTPQEAAQELANSRKCTGRWILGLLAVLIGVMVWNLCSKNVYWEIVIFLITLIGSYVTIMSYLFFTRGMICQLHFTGWTNSKDSD